jgi:mRNA interferase MazF
VVQSDLFEALCSVTVLPVTRELQSAPLMRIAVEPTDGNALRKKFQVMRTPHRAFSARHFGRFNGRNAPERP